MKSKTSSTHFDLIIIGAGISGICAAYHLQKKCPKKTFTILEGRTAMGGTWDFFHFPGIRSDATMQTYGFSFNPWKGETAIADGPEILAYMKETAKKFQIDQKIRYSHKVLQATWSSNEAKWSLEVARGTEIDTFTCNFLFNCSGYYKYDEGYTPEIAAKEKFQGKIIHPQNWPQNLDVTGKKIIVIGSGATAVTLVPNIAKTAALVTMLQRSPSFIFNYPKKNPLSFLTHILPEKIALRLDRWIQIHLFFFLYWVARKFPNFTKKMLLRDIKKLLKEDFNPADFTPPYQPWDQRVCLSVDGDLFKSIKEGKTRIVTDQIQNYTEKGLKLKSGKELEADIIITATGFNLFPGGGIELIVDGKPMKIAESFLYKGVLCSDIPNFAFFFGYINAAWTLRAELISDYLCRLLNTMDNLGAHQVVAPTPTDIEGAPFFGGADFTPGYAERSLSKVPKQGTKDPWKVYQSYRHDYFYYKYGRIEDDILKFSPPIN
ncbi:MAG: NAD(P)/FAD-dependent oxidoreductase [Verrucomicrobia bacterium]|nr:NAD(P)/FAD-dependent oxidoreductase [Verrucomicrobiota bacterium]